tara:strand:+ start:137 stop:424 length:288 start_codon:yes stop_codon:yes gene_type:complete
MSQKEIVTTVLNSLVVTQQIKPDFVTRILNFLEGNNAGEQRETYISVNEACKRSGYCRKTISRYIEDGSLKIRKTARGGIRIPSSEIDRVFGLGQ